MTELILPTAIDGLTLRPLTLRDAAAFFDLVDANRDHLREPSESASTGEPAAAAILIEAGVPGGKLADQQRGVRPGQRERGMECPTLRSS